MWEAIASNRRRSMWLIGLMGVILALLGAVIGLTLALYLGGGDVHARGLQPARPLAEELFAARNGLYFGITAAVVIWLVMWAIAAGTGDSILLSSAKARETNKEDAPQLWNVVEEMTIASGLGQMPKVFIIDDSSLNAFAVGYRPEKAAVAVTAGLLKRLSRDELQGVIAHEMGHIRNLDVKFMTLATVMVGAVVLISQGFLRGMFYGGGRRRSSREGGQAAVIMLIVAIVLAILAPLAAQLLYFACSRRREFLADASSARFTRYPPGLASALEKISQQAGAAQEVNKVIAPLYIVNPLQDRAAFSLLSTHPRTEDRIRILMSMGGAGFAAYEAAFQKSRGENQSCIGQATLKDDQAVPIREPAKELTTREQAVDRARAVGEMLERVLPFVVITCPCGVKLKLTPDFKGDSLKCPRCGRNHAVPRAEAQPAGPDAPAGPLRYQRRGAGWESFQCVCGHPVQLSPTFIASHAGCPNCQRSIEVIPALEG